MNELGKVDYSISIVVPAYDEEEVLGTFHERLSGILDKIAGSSEIIYVNDGSRDGTWDLMQRLYYADGRVSIINLSRNFGKEIALTAGLDHARGDAIVVIDADLQDPPELIPDLIRKWQEGFDVVYATRTSRAGETVLKRLTAKAFYRFAQSASRVKIPADTGDFRLLSRRAVDSLRLFREQHRFMKGLFSWIGYPQVAVPYCRDPRAAGKTKWNYWKLWNFALEGITSFSIGPLKISTYVGFVVAVSAAFFGLWILVRTLLYGATVSGYPTVMVTLLFLGGTQLMVLGVIGEYLGRMFNETKGRPLYITEAYLASRSLDKLDDQNSKLR